MQAAYTKKKTGQKNEDGGKSRCDPRTSLKDAWDTQVFPTIPSGYNEEAKSAPLKCLDT